MGKPYDRLKYKPPEEYRPDELISKGEAISMITDLLASNKSDRKLRRRVKNQIYYAEQTGRLDVDKQGRIIFNDLATWATQKYAEGRPVIGRMHHKALVQVASVRGTVTVGEAKSFETAEKYTAELSNENAQLREKLAERDAQIERDRPFTETGRKVRATP